MADEERTDLVSTTNGSEKCVFCRLASQFHTWRSQVSSSLDTPQIIPHVRTFTRMSVGVYRRGSSLCRGIHSWVAPPVREGLQGTRQLTVDSTRDVLVVIKDYAVVFFLYALVAVLFATLISMPRTPNEDLQVYVLAMLFPIIFCWLPFYCWRNGLFDLFKTTSSQDDRESGFPETATEKPPEYETLVFPASNSVLASAAPPTYEEAVPILDESRILSPNCRSGPNALPVCPVHQQSSARQPVCPVQQSSARQPVVSQDRSVQRSRSLGNLHVLDNDLPV